LQPGSPFRQGFAAHQGASQVGKFAFGPVLGAIYLERGHAEATNWLLPQVEKELVEILTEGRHYDYKGLLQKTAQKAFHITPIYQVISETGLEHERVFEIEASLAGRTLGRGEGSTKLIAQRAAAKIALPVLQAWVAELPQESSPKAESEKPSHEDEPV